MNETQIESLVSNIRQGVRMFAAETYEEFDPNLNAWHPLDSRPSIESQINGWLLGEGSSSIITGSSVAMIEEIRPGDGGKLHRKTRREALVTFLSKADHAKLLGVQFAVGASIMIPKSESDAAVGVLKTALGGVAAGDVQPIPFPGAPT